uniref:Dysbindin domain containing 2 n=1 Tax=Bos indicus x Bos taurus TaxID=30522 RepID=A0A4W2FYY6_BOBOX
MRGRGSPDPFPARAPSRGVRASKCGAWPRVPGSQSGCRARRLRRGLPGESGSRGCGEPCPRGPAGRSKCPGSRGVGRSIQGVRRVAGRRDACRELFVRAGTTSARARGGSRRPPGAQQGARVPAAALPPLPPAGASSFPAPGARPSRGRPGGAAPPRSARPAPTPPPPRRSGQPESAGAPGAAGADMDPNPRAALERQQLRLRERQKFFEDILQPETEFVFPLSHLHPESHRPPIGSISSMEVNVDTLEQVELIDLGDQDGADVFLPCEDPPPTPQTSGVDERPEEPSLPVPTPDRTTSRTSSLSSNSSTNPHSADASDGGADTPLAQSDEEEDGGHDGGAEPGACS